MTFDWDKAAAPPGPYASVVIPVWNAESTLGVQLEALAGQIDAPPFEVIVADNGSTDASREVAAGFAGRLNLRVVDASVRRGGSHARNTGAAAAATPRLLFCDADDCVCPRWVASMCAALLSNRMVAGPVVYVDALSPGALPPLPSAIPSKPRLYLDQIPFAPSNNFSLDAGLLRDLGGFDCELRCAEDADLTIRAQLGGNDLGWAQEAVVFNARRASLGKAAKQFFWYGYSDAALYRKLRGRGLSQRSAWQMLRPYLVLAATPHRLLTGHRRWSWSINASQRVGRVVGSIRFRVLCL